MNVCSSSQCRSPTREMISAEDWESLAEVSSRRIGCRIDPERLRESSEKVLRRLPEERQFVGDEDWSDSTYLHWVLCRAVETLIPERPVDEDVRVVYNLLHVGFLFLLETQEQLDRLRRPEPFDQHPEVPRTKLNRDTPRYVRPVDRVASRVVPEAMSPKRNSQDLGKELP